MEFSNKFTTFLALVVSTVCLGHVILADDICSKNSGIAMAWKRHPVNCSSLYICVMGKAVLFPKCSVGQVIAQDGKTCVAKGSPQDDCTASDDQIAPAIPSSCKVGETFASHESCAIYTECITVGKDGLATVKMECPFPLLFDTASGKCDHYNNVACQPGQLVPKNQCDYKANQCKSAHCVPCHIRFPSCNGHNDGLHAWAGKEWTPYFVMCEKERVLYQGECKSEKEVQVFHPEQKNCIKYDDKLYH